MCDGFSQGRYLILFTLQMMIAMGVIGLIILGIIVRKYFASKIFYDLNNLFRFMNTSSLFFKK